MGRDVPPREHPSRPVLELEEPRHPVAEREPDHVEPHRHRRVVELDHSVTGHPPPGLAVERLGRVEPGHEAHRRRDEPLEQGDLALVRTELALDVDRGGVHGEDTDAAVAVEQRVRAGIEDGGARPAAR